MTSPFGGPWFDDLSPGDSFDSAPGLTLTDGHAAVHQAIVGDRLRLALDEPLCQAVTEDGRAHVHPMLVCNVAIGQSTLATQRVIANKFYRGLMLRRLPRIGDTLRTVTEVLALKPDPPRGGRPPSGSAVLRVRTSDGSGRPVLDFLRCAMLPSRRQMSDSVGEDHFSSSPELPPASTLAAAAGDIDLEAFRSAVPGRHGDGIEAGMRWLVESGDPVTAAPELARLTLNLAAVHADHLAAGRRQRLVYGGHTIGLAAAQLTRVLPNLVTVLAWRSCDHVGPVHEGDVLRTEVSVERTEPLGRTHGTVVYLRCRVGVRDRAAEGGRPVLDWRPVALFA